MDFIVQNYNIDRKALQESIDENGLLYTSNILSESLDKSVDNAYIAGTLYAMHLREKATNMYEFYKDKPYLFDPEVRQYILDHYTELEAYIDHTRDYGKQYSAVKTFAKNYLFKYKGKGIESIQWAWMRVAVQVAMPNLDEVLRTYDMMSKNEAIHATPTCINAGYCIPQLESCFCGRIGDSMLEIADVQKLLLMGSKCNGGFGIFMGDIRHSRVANRGITKGVTGLCRVINSLVPYADQLGSRPMAVNVQLPIWHCDIPTFITMKDENTAIDIKATKLNYTVCIPDLFMKRCYTGGSWSLFCPRECKLLWVEKHGGDVDNTHEVDRAPSLCDVNGDEFEEYYTMCEQGGIAKETWNANDLYLFLNKYRCMVGEPYIFFHDNVNRKSNHQHLGTTVQTNLCVHGNTLILTDEGYQPIRELADKMVNVWNGEEWSEVTPMKTGENQQLITVSFSNGSKIKCTPYHKFHIQHGYKSKAKIVDAQDLDIGMKIIKCDYPVIEKYDEDEEHLFSRYAYTHGFFCADGTYANNKPYVRLYGAKEDLVKYLNIRGNPIAESGIQQRLCCKLPLDIPHKYLVPLRSSINTKIKWLEGLFDGDGTVVHTKHKDYSYDTLQLASTNRVFIDDIKLLLQTLGCNCKYTLTRDTCKEYLPKNDGTGEYQEYVCKPLYRLVVSTKNLKSLYDLGFRTHRLKFSIPNVDGFLSQKDTSRYITVVSIDDYSEYADTYCFNESKRHMGIFNGIIAGNCTEITQYTGNKGSPHGEMVATCDLATINVSSLVQEDSSFNWHRLGIVTRQLVRNLDRVLDRTSGVIIEKPNKEMEMYLQDDNPMIRRIAQDMLHNMDPTNRARERMRSIGIGIMGLASCFALMNIQYGSKESFSLGTKIRACIEWHSKDESSNLAQIYGSYPTFEGSPLSKGILQHDMWRHEDNYMSQYLNDLHNKEYDGYTKRYTYKEVDPVSFGVEDTWYNLRQKIMQHGVRNSLTTCQMPNATTSGIFGVSASIEPFYEVYYIVDNTNGKDTTIYDCVRDIFKKHNLYDAEKIASYLYTNKGRIDGLHKVYPLDVQENVKRIESLFPSSFSINKKKYLMFMQMMGRYVDQAQSTNIFFDKPNDVYLSRLSFLDWINGSKTEYYLRRLAGTDKIDPFMDTEKNVCKKDEGCMCCE